jgi:hypothetical protein
MSDGEGMPTEAEWLEGTYRGAREDHEADPHPAPSAAEVPKFGRFTDDGGNDVDIIDDFYVDDGSPALVITKRPGQGGPQACIRLTPKLAAWLVDALAASPPAELSPVGLSEDDRKLIAAVLRTVPHYTPEPAGHRVTATEQRLACLLVSLMGVGNAPRPTDGPEYHAEFAAWVERCCALLASPVGPQRGQCFATLEAVGDAPAPVCTLPHGHEGAHTDGQANWGTTWVDEPVGPQREPEFVIHRDFGDGQPAIEFRPAGPLAGLGDRESLLRQARIWAKEDQGIEALVAWLDELLAGPHREGLAEENRELRDVLKVIRPSLMRAGNALPDQYRTTRSNIFGAVKIIDARLEPSTPPEDEG